MQGAARIRQAEPRAGPRIRTDVWVDRAMNSSVEESAINLPRPITMRWSAVSAISDSRWDETKTVLPCAARFLMKVLTQKMPSGSRPLTGSSNSSTCGSPRSAPASPSRCFMPSENLPAARLATLLSPTMSSTSSTLDTGILLDAAMNLRWERAERFGCCLLYTSDAADEEDS